MYCAAIKMKQRVLSGVVIAVVAISVLLLMNTVVFPIVWTVLAVMAVYEIEKVTQIKNKALMILSLVFSALFCLNESFGFVDVSYSVVLAVYVLIMLTIMLIGYDITKFEHVAVAFFASVAVPFAFSIFVYLRDINLNSDGKFSKTEGVYLILLVLVCSWLTDVFAYFTGRAFGKHKLCPKISPKKTVEGAIGGIIIPAVINIIVLAVFEKFFFDGTVIPYWAMLIISPVLSVASMLGDLSASTIKRNFGVKDFSNLIPGHGGIMDRFDSCLFVLPAIYVIVNLF